MAPQQQPQQARALTHPPCCYPVRPTTHSRSSASNLGATSGATCPAATAALNRSWASPTMAAEMSEAHTEAPFRARGMARLPVTRDKKDKQTHGSARHALGQHLHAKCLAAALHVAPAKAATLCGLSALQPLLGHSPPTNSRTCPAAGVADGCALEAALLLQPVEHLVHCLCMALPDVQLHLVDLIGLPINLLPAVEAVVVEVRLDLRGLFVWGPGATGLEAQIRALGCCRVLAGCADTARCCVC